MRQVADQVIGAGDADLRARHPVVRALEERPEQPELVEHFHRRGVNRVATEIAEEVGVLFEHPHGHARAGEQIARHHPGRTAADNQNIRAKIGHCVAHAPSDIAGAMHGETISPFLSDALVILGAAGIVIPLFARLRITPVIGFILVGVLVGPYGLGGQVFAYDWLYWVTITDPQSLAPFAEFGIILLLFTVGLELSFNRLWALRRLVFGLGALELAIIGLLLTAFLSMIGQDWTGALALGLALDAVLDRAGAADRRHADPGRARGAGDAAVRGHRAGADHLPAWARWPRTGSEDGGAALLHTLWVGGLR